jgi:hypothetical protein
VHATPGEREEEPEGREEGGSGGAGEDFCDGDVGLEDEGVLEGEDVSYRAAVEVVGRG